MFLLSAKGGGHGRGSADGCATYASFMNRSFGSGRSLLAGASLVSVLSNGGRPGEKHRDIGTWARHLARKER